MFCRLAFLMLSLLFMSSSGALALECERYKLAQTGFSTPAAAESWYPKFMSFNNSDFEPKGGSSKNMIFEDKNWTDSEGNQTSVKYSLLKNGKLIARVDFAAGYQDPDDSRYKCDMTSVELKEANASGLSSDNNSTKSSENQNNWQNAWSSSGADLFVDQSISSIKIKAQSEFYDKLFERYINEPKTDIRFGLFFTNNKLPEPKKYEYEFVKPSKIEASKDNNAKVFVFETDNAEKLMSKDYRYLYFMVTDYTQGMFYWTRTTPNK